MGKLNMLLEKRKQINFEAQEFFKNKSNPMKERLAVFDEFGEHEEWVSTFNNESLEYINEMIRDFNIYSKNDTVNIVDVLIDYLYDLKDYSFIKKTGSNGLKKVKRLNKVPKEVIDRYENYLLNKLMEEGVKSYIMDW